MKTINHQHIVRCHDVFNTPDELCIVMELVRDGDLFDLIKKERCFEEGRARRLLWQLIIAVDHLHNVCNIAHRDLKPENILVSARGLPPPSNPREVGPGGPVEAPPPNVRTNGAVSCGSAFLLSGEGLAQGCRFEVRLCLSPSRPLRTA